MLKRSVKTPANYAPLAIIALCLTDTNSWRTTAAAQCYTHAYPCVCVCVLCVLPPCI